MPAVAFVGIGAMGAGMAVHLLHQNYQVAAFDVNEKALQEFASHGGQVARNARAAVQTVESCDVLIIMVATAQQASSVMFDDQAGCATSLPHGAVVLLCITASPEYAANTRVALDELGRDDIVLLDCPVSGGANRAADGTLSILVAGSTKIPEKGEKVLQALSSNLNHVPGSPGSAFALKMVHQILVGSHIVAANEVMGLAALAGLDFDTVYRVVMSSDASSWLYGERVPHMQDLGHPPYSSLAIILKDMTLVTAAARTKHYVLPMASITQQILLLANAAGFGTHDDCATIQVYLRGREDILLQQNTRKHSFENGSKAVYSITIETIQALLVGIHLATAVEVFSFLEFLQSDQEIFYDFVLNAAGVSTMFRKLGSQVKQQASISLQHLQNVDNIIDAASRAVECAYTAMYPVPLASTALNCLFASRN